jgi:hypothetical protein
LEDRTQTLNRRKVFKQWLFALLSLVIVVQLSCNFFRGLRSSDPVSSTLDSLYAQQTDLYETLSAFTAIARQGDSTRVAQSTLDASLTTATAQARLVATLASSPQSSVTPGLPVDPDERLLKSARILLFEDMSASPYIRIVKEALDTGGYFYLDVGSAKGWFKTQLLSGMEWDLIIAAAEANREFGGEFFEYIDAHVARGAAAIVENWDFDLAPRGKAGQFLNRCGVRFQTDWFEPNLRVFYWLQPDHPVFNRPNSIPPALRNARRIWTGDIGDLLEGDSTISTDESAPIFLAGTNPNQKNQNAVLASCLGGRVIIQTFRTHEYHHDDMLMLWQNYIYNALTSYFSQTGKSVPTPAVTALANPEVTSTPAGPTPGPDYIFEHGCDGIFSIKLTEAPRFQRDLFEHHAEGQFLILDILYQNQTEAPIMVWDGDYSVEGRLAERLLEYQLNREATGYLFIEGAGELVQDVIGPGEKRRVRLAFDITPKGEDWELVFRPGSEFDSVVCEARIPLYR